MKRFCKRNAVIGFCALSLAACGVPSPFSGQQQNRTEVYAPPPGGTAVNEMPALEPMDLRADQLFSEELRNNDERIERIETVVMAMKEEIDGLNQLKPAIERLVAIESEFENLVGLLENLLQNTDTTPMPGATLLPAPESARAQRPPQATAPTPVSQESVSAGAVQGLNLRIGEHPGYTRAVLDLSHSVTYRTDLDNEEKILIIEMPGVAWAGPVSSPPMNSPLIAAWTVQPMANQAGTRIIIQLRHPVTIVSEKKLTGPNRILLDFQKI